MRHGTTQPGDDREKPPIRASHFRWAWLTLGTALISLYLGLGRPIPWGIVPLLSIAPLLAPRNRPAARRALGGAYPALIVVVGLVLLGNILLPRRPSPATTIRRAAVDQERVGRALVTVEERMSRAARTISDRFEAGSGSSPAQDLEAGWETVGDRLWPEATTVVLHPADGGPAIWRGSPFLTEGSDGALPRFRVTGDSMAAVGRVSRSLEAGTLEVVVLLARAESADGPLPGVTPVLARLLPGDIAGRLRILPDPTDEPGVVRIAGGPPTAGGPTDPMRAFLQVLILLLLPIASLLLLLRDDSVARGLLAAPIIYAAFVPLTLGAYRHLLGFGLVAPGWSGLGLTNQAFLAAGAAGLALWFALVQGRSAPASASRVPAWAAFCAITLLWGIGLALFGDLYRFAPTWFWARVGLLPGSRDLVGWLIAVALTLTLLGSSGGLVLLARKGGRPSGSLAWGTCAAALGGLLGDLVGAWSGGVMTALVVPAAATAGAALWLTRGERRQDLRVLLGLAVVGALIHLPLRWDLGGGRTRGVVEEAAESLSDAGIGLSAADVEATLTWLRKGDAASSIGSGDRDAYLLWRGLGLPRIDLSSGIQILDSPGSVTGRFSTASDLFAGSVADSLRARTARGEGELLLTGARPAYFGEETLLMGIPARAGRRAVAVAMRRRPLSFLATGEDRLWAGFDRSGSADRAGRLAGSLYVRIYDEAYRLLALPLNPTLAPPTGTVSPAVVARLRETDRGGAWSHRGWWPGGFDEYFFWVESPSVHPPVPGGAVTAQASVERRIASIGVVRSGLWDRVTEMLSLLVLFVGAILLLVWLPSALLGAVRGGPTRRLRSTSFRTRLLIPLLVVSLVPMIALWLLTRSFVLERESADWEGTLDQSLREVNERLLSATRQWASELSREAERGTRFPEVLESEAAQWAVFDPELVRTAGNLSDELADRIPLREAVIGRGPSSFVVRSGPSLWSAAITSIGPEFEGGAALVAMPLTEEGLRAAAGASPWEVDLFLDGRLHASTEPAPYTSGILPRVLPHAVEWEGSRGREASAFRWGAVAGMRYLSAFRPLTDYAGTVTATISQRRFGLWGLRDPEMARLFTTVASIYLLLVGAVTLVAVFLARRISRPVGNLTHFARRVAGGDLEVEIPVTRGDEVGSLQKAFRQMLIALRENRDRLALAERERAWQTMARQVAHEIKNPLTPMRLSAQFLRKAYSEEAPELDRIVAECTDAIVEQVEELRRIANEFSTYARLPHVERTPADLNQPLEEALNLFLPALPDGVTMIRDLAAEMPRVPLDAEQVRRVAINLIRNALDAMGEEGTLTVRSGSDEEGVWMQVSDTGEGIAREVQERLFEPYFSTRTDGTGLGLAITRAVVDAHGGTVSVESIPGEGTTMTAHFPHTDPANPSGTVQPLRR